jgi:solute carrier family 50 protein (sugar transporter)
LLVATLLYVENKENFEEAKKCLGIVCCVVTILFFAAPLASLLHVIKMKNSESLPFPIIFASFVVSMQWLIYGYILKDTFIQVPIIDSSCKKPLCLCNSTFMALVI